jgi:hypothetical protein
MDGFGRFRRLIYWARQSAPAGQPTIGILSKVIFLLGLFGHQPLIRIFTQCGWRIPSRLDFTEDLQAGTRMPV